MNILGTKQRECVYILPEVEVIEVCVECGFGGSIGDGNPGGTGEDMGWG